MPDWPTPSPDDDRSAEVIGAASDERPAPPIVGTLPSGPAPRAYEWIETGDGWVAVDRNAPLPDSAGAPGPPAADDPLAALAAAIPAPPQRRLRRDVVEALGMALLLFLGIQAVMRQFIVENISMLPTLDPGDRIFVDRVSWRLTSELERGDVVVFRAWDEDKLYVKRIIGLPGDTLAMADGEVFVNGERLDEPYLVQHADESKPSTVLGPDAYFVMGDNRPSSADSRLHGPVERAAIVGRAWAIFWPLDDVAWLHRTPRLYAAPAP